MCPQYNSPRQPPFWCVSAVPELAEEKAAEAARWRRGSRIISCFGAGNGGGPKILTLFPSLVVDLGDQAVDNRNTDN